MGSNDALVLVCGATGTTGGEITAEARRGRIRAPMRGESDANSRSFVLLRKRDQTARRLGCLHAGHGDPSQTDSDEGLPKRAFQARTSTRCLTVDTNA